MNTVNIKKRKSYGYNLDDNPHRHGCKRKTKKFNPKDYSLGGLFCIVCIIDLTDSCNPFDFLDHSAKLLP